MLVTACRAIPEPCRADSASFALLRSHYDAGSLANDFCCDERDSGARSVFADHCSCRLSAVERFGSHQRSVCVFPK